MNWPTVLTQWSIEPSILAGVALAALLYWRGWRPLSSSGTVTRRRTWHAVAFYAGLLVVVLALESPIDALAAKLFTFHMIEHLLLIMVAAPLLVLGDPGVTMLRGVPLSTRRRVLGLLARRSLLHRLDALLHPLRSPFAVVVLFLGDLYLWHWYKLFNLTLSNNAVHITEHVCFLVTAVLFWGQVIDQRALPSGMSYVHRAVYTLATAAAGNALAMYLVFAPKPAYSGYAHLPTRLYGMSVLVDQQIAGAIMWVPVLFIFGGAFCICLYKALQEDERKPEMSATGMTPYSLFGPTSNSVTRP